MLHYIIIVNSYTIYIYSIATHADTKELKRPNGTIRINRVDSFNHLRLQIDNNKHRIRHYKTVIESRNTSNQHERTMRCTEEIREKNIHKLIGSRKTGEGSGLQQKEKNLNITIDVIKRRSKFYWHIYEYKLSAIRPSEETHDMTSALNNSTNLVI